MICMTPVSAPILDRPMNIQAKTVTKLDCGAICRTTPPEDKLMMMAPAIALHASLRRTQRSRFKARGNPFHVVPRECGRPTDHGYLNEPKSARRQAFALRSS